MEEENLKDLGERLQGLREACDVSRHTMAEELGVDIDTYRGWEETGEDIPISAIYHMARKFNVDLTEILTGTAPKLDTYHLVRRGETEEVERFPGYHYEDMASRYARKIMQPLLVILDPCDEPAELVCHDGQEFNYVLEGSLILTFGDRDIQLNAGDSIYFNREGRYGEGGAYRDANSPYRGWYDFDPKYKGGYRSWWGFETLPEVNEETPSFVEFITGEGGVIDTWLRRGAAGFRLDVADELPDAFIEKIRTAVKRVSPEKFLLGEVWEDATTKFGFDHRRTYLLGKGLDSVMNYPFKNSVLDFVKGKPAQQAANEILSICEHYPAPAINTALNFLSTHDTERALTVIADEPANGRGREWQSGRSVTGEAYEEGMLRLRMAYAIIYTLPGVPCLYYGDEIGMQGYRDPFNRAFFCWDSHEERLRPVLAQLAQLRHSCEAFRTGELRVLRAEDGILHYQRIGKTETAEIIVNRSEHIIVEPLASGKHTEVNPMGFTIVVEENGHNPNHSYYDIQ